MDDAQKNAIDSAVVDALGEDKDMIGLFLAELAMNGDAHYNKLKLLTSMPQAIKAYAQKAVSLAAPAAADGKGKGKGYDSKVQQGNMHIKIRPLSGDETKMEVNGTDTVASVKASLHEQLGKSQFNMTLIKGKMPLLDDLASLDDVGVKDGQVLTLIVKGYPPPTKQDQEMIIDLVEANDIEGLRKAAMDGYDLNVIGERDDGYYYVLHQAIWIGNFEMMKLVLETGVSVFSITRVVPKTALQVAAKCGHRDICEWLIMYGLDPHEKDTMTSDGSGRSIYHWSAVNYAEENNHPELAQWLKEQPSPEATYSVIQ